MVRARTGHKRCDVCRLHPSVCMCVDLPHLNLRTRVSILFWHEERYKTTNTGMLALACLEHSKCHYYAAPEPISEPIFAEDEQPVVLFPTEDAVPLSQFADCSKPVHLIVPDGTWRQASKIVRKMPALQQAPRCTLPPGKPSRYSVRTNPRDGAVCTMEAIARSMGILENETVASTLDNTFRTFMDRLLWIRGTLPGHLVYGGLPEGARRHDPFSGTGS